MCLDNGLVTFFLKETTYGVIFPGDVFYIEDRFDLLVKTNSHGLAIHISSGVGEVVFDNEPVMLLQDTTLTIKNKEKEGKAMIDPNIEQIKQIAEFYGWEAQSRQLIEEMSELMKAINKLYRLEKYPWQFIDNIAENDDRSVAQKIKDEIDSYKYPILTDIAEEITDVEICLAEIKYLFKKQYDWEPSSEGARKDKIDREIYRITKCSDSEKETMERAIINSLPAGTEERIKNEIFKELFRQFSKD